MDYLIGMDDTDDLYSRGTGYRARQLGRWLEWYGVARLHGITRHQLSAAPGIPKTSKNSAACLQVTLPVQDMGRLKSCLLDFLQHVAAPTAQPGLCLAPVDSVPIAVQRFGRRCKQVVVELSEALATAHSEVHLLAPSESLGSGRIGALAAVGLRASGEDGRFIWLPGLRSLKGVKSMAELSRRSGIEAACSPVGVHVAPTDRIRLNDWIRPLLRAGRSTLMVESAEGRGDCEWELLDKRRVKQLDE